MELDITMREFAGFLDRNLPNISKFNSISDETVDDWIQANWELLVEFSILENGGYLEVYGVGADINGASSRILFPDATPSHYIAVKSRILNIIDVLNDESFEQFDFRFDRFVGMTGGYYSENQNFDFVLCLDDKKNQRVFPIRDVLFDLRKM